MRCILHAILEKRFMHFCRALFFILLFCFTFSNQAANRPNIIMILADDLGWHDVGFNGRKEWSTPNLDRFAKQGTIFNRWYVGGVVCAPSRAVLMTGKYTIHNGVTGNSGDLPAEETTIAEALKQYGYTTALFGKWHGGKPRDGSKTSVHPIDHGFDEFFGFTDAKHAWEHFPKQLWFGREKKPLATNAFTATMFVDRSVEFVQRNKQQPFFLYLAFTEPHLHIEAPDEDVAKFGKFPEKDPGHSINANYAAMISRMDKEIGRLLNKLDQLGLAENTLVVFTSDHGATFEKGNEGAAAFHDSNFPFRGQKRTLWEGGIRVPAVVRWPGKIPAGKTSREIVHMMDVFPSFLAAAGEKTNPDWNVDGLNLLPVWMGLGKTPERTLFWEWRSEGNQQLAAMRGDLKLVSTGNNKPELFNVETDPAERRSLAAEQEMLTKDLEKELNDWLATEKYK
ncbi:MAG: sulfatase-like hydrolase/transferase [Verrucomicrobiota bacterium]